MSKPTAADRLEEVADAYNFQWEYSRKQFEQQEPGGKLTPIEYPEDCDIAKLLRNAAELVRACEEMDGGYNEWHGYCVSADEWDEFQSALAKLQGSKE